jgi:nickel/cobalt exporter
MRRTVTLGALALAVLAALVWISGGAEGLATWAQSAQRGFQDQMATGLRALRAGQPGALATFWGLCFAYGFVHAAGPGHGKFLLGAYGAGHQVALARMAGIGLAASLAQGVSAIVLVYGGVLIFNATREGLQLAGDIWLERASLSAIALIGLWLVIRATRRGLRQTLAPLAGVAAHAPVAHSGAGAARLAHSADAGHSAHAGHGHGVGQAQCESCGHKHGPELHEVAALTGWRDTLLLVGAIAIRPCTGALFVLVLTWRMGLIWQGMAAVMIMALGTAMVTVAVAGLAVLAREGALDWAARLGRARGLGPILEALAGLFILLVALNMLKII